MIDSISRPGWRTAPIEAANGILEGAFVPVVGPELGPHVAAVAGIVALAAFGGLLLLRNRFTEYDTGGEAFATTEEDFLTDRERIHRLIEENGGRMKQSEIVDAVDWSKAKVSRLLADLEDDGEITKLRLGRENLICLEGNEPTASKSPERSGTD